MTVFLWHQTAHDGGHRDRPAPSGPLPGLHTVPDGLGWVRARLAWLPVFALALLVCRAAFRAFEQGPRGSAAGRRG